MDKTGERWWEAELYRLTGEFLLAQKGKSEKVKGESEKRAKAEAEAEECFHKALAITRQQQAESWELRATMSLSWLWRRQGKTVEARQLLAAVYGWFTEGFDTKDLKDAKVLLQELS